MTKDISNHPMRSQARDILQNLAQLPTRPSLIQLARLVAATEEGTALTQSRLQGRATQAPHLRVIDGGRATAPAQHVVHFNSPGAEMPDDPSNGF